MRLARVATPSGPVPVVADGDDWAAVEDIFVRPLVRTGRRYPQRGAALLAPIEPRVVLGMSHNAGPADRARPPQAILKSARTVVGPGDPIRLDARRGEVGVDGSEAARSTTAALAWIPGESLCYTSSHMRLGPADVLLTGAPDTATAVTPGSTSSMSIVEVGPLVNPVR